MIYLFDWTHIDHDSFTLLCGLVVTFLLVDLIKYIIRR